MLRQNKGTTRRKEQFFMKKKGEKKYLTQLHEKKEEKTAAFSFSLKILLFLFSFVDERFICWCALE